MALVPAFNEFLYDTDSRLICDENGKSLVPFTFYRPVSKTLGFWGLFTSDRYLNPVDHATEQTAGIMLQWVQRLLTNGATASLAADKIDYPGWISNPRYVINVVGPTGREENFNAGRLAFSWKNGVEIAEQSLRAELKLAGIQGY